MIYWSEHGVTCFERWTLPYFFKLEKENKKPCLRLNWPVDGKCAECSRGSCGFDRVCFLCGQEGHGAYQAYPSGRLKGELKCGKHRDLTAQRAALLAAGVTEEDLLALYAVEPSPDPVGLVVSVATLTPEQRAQAVQNFLGSISTSDAEGEQSPLQLVELPSGPLAWRKSPGGEGSTKSAGSGGLVLPPSVEMGPSVWSTPHQSRSGSITSPYSGSTGPGPVYSSLSLQPQTGGTPLQQLQSLGGGGGMDPLTLPFSAATTGGSREILRPPASPVIGPRSRSNTIGSAHGPVGPSSARQPALALSNSAEKIRPVATGSNSGSKAQAHTGSSTGDSGASATQQFVELDVSGVDEYHFGGTLCTTTLRYAPWLPARTSPLGRQLHCLKGVLLPAGEDVLEEVIVLCWPLASGALAGGDPSADHSVDLQALAKELKTLRLLARTHPTGIARVLSRRPLAAPHLQLHLLVQEYSELGYLDRFLATHRQAHPDKPGLGPADLRCAAAMLTDALLHCHRMQVCHRDLRPATVLVTRPSRYQRDLLLGLFSLKLTDFRLASMAGLYGGVGLQLTQEQERYSAPEVNAARRDTGLGYDCASDVWSLGLVVYYAATGGLDVVDSRGDLFVAGGSEGDSGAAEELQQHYRALTQRHGLQDRAPVLHDFVDRTVRPAGRRISCVLLRCHPLLWTVTRQRDFLLSFSYPEEQPAPAHLEPFLTAFDKYAPQYVFGGPAVGQESPGWTYHMRSALLAPVRSALRSEQWWSGRGLLLALRGHLLGLESLAPLAYPGLSPAQALAAYLREMTEQSYPRLLNLMFELGGTYGVWSWDGDEVGHRWR